MMEIPTSRVSPQSFATEATPIYIYIYIGDASQLVNIFISSPEGLMVVHDYVIKWKLFSALLALCAGNSPVTGKFPAQRPVTWSFGVFFDQRLNNRWVKTREADDLRRRRAHYDVIVMSTMRFMYMWDRSQRQGSILVADGSVPVWC